MYTFVGVDSWDVSSGVPSVVSTAASGDPVAAFGSSSSSSSSAEIVRTQSVLSTNSRLTFGVYFRMLPEAILHGLELLHTVNTLWFLFREYETRESLPELHTARPVGHSPQTRTVPIDFSGFGIIGGRPWLGFVRAPLRFAALQSIALLFVAFLFRGRRRRFGLFRSWFRFRDGGWL